MFLLAPHSRHVHGLVVISRLVAIVYVYCKACVTFGRTLVVVVVVAVHYWIP